MEFKQMHAQQDLLLLANVWDAGSARAAKSAGYTALGTSSAAMASSLGHGDGEEMSFAELKYLVGRILKTVDLPLSVDLEAGYSRSAREIAAHIQELVEMGVVGINLEDSLVKGERSLVPTQEFAELLSAVNAQLLADKVDVFLNVRTDTFLLGQANPLAATLERIQAYEAAGANGIFVPGLTEVGPIQAVVESTKLPLNLMCMPELPGFEELARLGVKRVSMGNFLYDQSSQRLESSFRNIYLARSFSPIFTQ